MDPMTPSPAAPTPPPPGAVKKPWYRQKRWWAAGVVAVIAIGAASSGSSQNAKLTGAQGQVVATTAPAATPTTQAAAPATTTAPKPTTTTMAPKPTTTTTKAVSGCEAVRESLLTGTQAEINAAMTRLIADKSAAAAAREYADNYMHRDAPPAYGSKDLRDMDVSIIRMNCE